MTSSDTSPSSLSSAATACCVKRTREASRDLHHSHATALSGSRYCHDAGYGDNRGLVVTVAHSGTTVSEHVADAQ